MGAGSRNSELSMQRLSRYHCLLGQLQGVRSRRPVTSREIAEELGLSEETVRHDLKNVRVEGRPGSGFDAAELYAAIQEYLDLSTAHPFIAVGNADLLRGLTVTFPAEQFGMRVVGYASERPEDEGLEVAGDRIRPLAEVADLVSDSGAMLALLACAPDVVAQTAAALREAGITGVLVLTPVLSPFEIDGLEVTYFRMPCALKSLARGAAERKTACCGASAT